MPQDQWLSRANAYNDQYQHHAATAAAAEGLALDPDNEGLRQAYAIAAGYQGDDPEIWSRGFALCDGLALDPSVSPAVRNAARSNLAFYAPLLAEMVPGAKLYRIPWEAPDGYHACNPGLAVHAGRLFANVRAVNYRIQEDGSYFIPPEHEGQIRTRNFLLEMGDDLSVQSAREIMWDGPSSAQFAGIEDLRLVSVEGVLMCSGTVCTLEPSGQRQMVCGRLEGRDTIDDWHVIEVVPGRDEKNWMPFAGPDGPGFVYSLDPVMVIGQFGNIIGGSKPEIALDHLRGGACDPMGQLMITHEVAHVWGRRRYMHRLIHFSPVHATVLKISHPFFLARSGAIEFACGLVLRGGKVLISFGIEDGEAWIAELTEEEFGRMVLPPDAILDGGRNG